MSRKTVTRSTAKPATVSDHLQRLVQAMPEPLQTTAETTSSPKRASRADAAASRSDSLALDRMAEHRDFAGRVAALTVAIQRDRDKNDGWLVSDLLRALEDLAHAEYSTVAENMRAFEELQASREVHA